MTRTPRPSQMHRLPTQDHEPPAPPPAAPHRGGRGLLLAVGGAAVALVLATVLTDADRLAGQPTRLDVDSEDEAVAALGLFAAQQAAAAAIGPQILGQPGPHEMSRQARAGAASTTAALHHARSQSGPAGPAAGYWSSPGHDWFVGQLRDLADLADDIGLLAAVHDTVYGGAGLIGLQEAEPALVNRFRAARPAPPALERWSDALLAELDGRDAAAPAADARRATEQHWADVATRLEPPDVDRLRGYLQTLSPALVEALRGHPVAGPAIGRLQG